MDIDITDYLSNEEIHDICKEELRAYVRRNAANYYRNGGTESILNDVARRFVRGFIDVDDDGFRDKVTGAVRRTIDELRDYDVFGFHSDEPNAARRVMNECVEELRPEIKEKVRELYLSKVEGVNAAEIVSDAVYDIFLKALGGREE